MVGAARLIVLLAALLLAALADASAQSGFDRPGGDYSNFAVASVDPAACAARCEREGRCRAWSFSYPRTATTSATCWLKNRVTKRIEEACCVSGVKGAAVLEKKGGPIEFSIDRTGGDYKNLDVATDPSGASCETVCKGEERCRAWTYVRPGYQGAQPRCYLKAQIKPPRRSPCCLSGVVR